MHSLTVEYTELPPSDNAIRELKYSFAGGKRVTYIGYTKVAEDYKKGVIRALNDMYFVELQRFAKVDTPTALYMLHIVLVFPPEEVLNVSWLTGKAKNPYKKSDVANRRKLLEDCLSESLGIDDSRFWETPIVKLVGAQPKVSMCLHEVNPLDYGVPASYLRVPR